MKPLASAILLMALLTLLPTPAHAAAPLALHLDVEVQPDRSEQMSLAFANLDPRTRYLDLCLPHGVDPGRMRDAEGDLPYDMRQEEGRWIVSFQARGTSATLDLMRDAPSRDRAPLYNATVNLCAAAQSPVSVLVTVPAGHRLFDAAPAARPSPDGTHVRMETTGPATFRYSYEAPHDPALGLLAFDVPPLRVFAPEANLSAARRLAQIAAPLVAESAQEAGLPIPFPRLYVRFMSDVGGWEAGHYGGDGILVVREDLLLEDPRAGFPYVGARVLLHEAFHALSAPHGTGEYGSVAKWWLEGTAVHAQRLVDRALPEGDHHCERSFLETRCWDFNDSLGYDALAANYRAGWRFDLRWDPQAPQSDEVRHFHYQYAGFLVDAYVERHGAGAYRAAWQAIRDDFDDASCSCDAMQLVRHLTTAAGGISEDEILHPWRTLFQADERAFQEAVAPWTRDASDSPLREFGRIPGLDVPAWGAAPLLAVGVAMAVRGRPRR